MRISRAGLYSLVLMSGLAPAATYDHDTRVIQLTEQEAADCLSEGGCRLVTYKLLTTIAERLERAEQMLGKTGCI